MEFIKKTRRPKILDIKIKTWFHKIPRINVTLNKVLYLEFLGLKVLKNICSCIKNPLNIFWRHFLALPLIKGTFPLLNFIFLNFFILSFSDSFLPIFITNQFLPISDLITLFCYLPDSVSIYQAKRYCWEECVGWDETTQNHD